MILCISCGNNKIFEQLTCGWLSLRQSSGLRSRTGRPAKRYAKMDSSAMMSKRHSDMMCTILHYLHVMHDQSEIPSTCTLNPNSMVQYSMHYFYYCFYSVRFRRNPSVTLCGHEDLIRLNRWNIASYYTEQYQKALLCFNIGKWPHKDQICVPYCSRNIREIWRITYQYLIKI